MLLGDLDKHLRRAVRKYGVPGASVAVLRGGRITGRAAAGVLNTETGVKATPNSLFQIGSITKPMTATMILQLRDEGRLDLDDLVLDHLPHFRVADMDRLRRTTLRHLLTHTSGIDGDFYPRTDVGDRSVEQLLDQCAMVPSLFEPGTNFSYCNVGFAILGRIIEMLDRRSWDESLQARVFDTLSMRHAFSRPELSIRYRVAVGHIPGRDGEPVVPSDPYLCFGMKPAGSTTAMTAEDLLKFAAAHMHQGMGLNGSRLLSRRSAVEMTRPANRPPSASNAARPNRGLPWIVHSWSGQKILAHTGGTLGQRSTLVVCPAKQLAIAALTNGGEAERLFQDIIDGLLKSLARIEVPQPPRPVEDVRVRADDLVGVYENTACRAVVEQADDGLTMTSEWRVPDALRDPNAKNEPVKPQPLRFVSPRLARVGDMLVDFGPGAGLAPWMRIPYRVLVRR